MPRAKGMPKHLTVPKRCDGLPLTGKEKSWADICDSLGLDYNNQSAHKLVMQKYPELHRKVHQWTAPDIECIYENR